MIQTEGGEKDYITRLHLMRLKSIHDQDIKNTLIDLNRSSVFNGDCLEPDLRSPRSHL